MCAYACERSYREKVVHGLAADGTYESRSGAAPKITYNQVVCVYMHCGLWLACQLKIYLGACPCLPSIARLPRTLSRSMYANSDNACRISKTTCKASVTVST